MNKGQKDMLIFVSCWVVAILLFINGGLLIANWGKDMSNIFAPALAFLWWVCAYGVLCLKKSLRQKYVEV